MSRPNITSEQLKEIIAEKQFDKLYRSEIIQTRYDKNKEQALKSLPRKLNQHRDRKWVLRKNDYPYQFEKGLEHWIIWNIKGDWTELEKDYHWRLPIGCVAHWVNPPQFRSVANIPHAHVVVEVQTFYKWHKEEPKEPSCQYLNNEGWIEGIVRQQTGKKIIKIEEKPICVCNLLGTNSLMCWSLNGRKLDGKIMFQHGNSCHLKGKKGFFRKGIFKDETAGELVGWVFQENK